MLAYIINHYISNMKSNTMYQCNDIQQNSIIIFYTLILIQYDIV